MKFLTAFSFLTVAAYIPFASGATGVVKEHEGEEVDYDSNLRGSNDGRYLTEGLSIPTESRIVGGTDAPVNAYPFFVSWSGCGASLVADDVILSAAHCRGQSSNQVTVGQSRKGSSSNGTRRRITRRVSHPNYRSSSINYDYMVMKLDRPVDTDRYPPIRLNQQNAVPISDEELTVIGFGALSEGGFSTPSRLQEVNVNYIPTSTCNQRNSYGGDVRDSTMFCAGTGGGKDSCQGDSGGPIFTNREPIEQVGIVSWGRGCAQRRYPGVYSRVSGEFDWIKDQVCSLATNPPDYLCNNNGNPVVPGPIGSPTAPTASPRPPTQRPTRRPTGEQSDPFREFLCTIFGIFC